MQCTCDEMQCTAVCRAMHCLAPPQLTAAPCAPHRACSASAQRAPSLWRALRFHKRGGGCGGGGGGGRILPPAAAAAAKNAVGLSPGAEGTGCASSGLFSRSVKVGTTMAPLWHTCYISVPLPAHSSDLSRWARSRLSLSLSTFLVCRAVKAGRTL